MRTFSPLLLCFLCVPGLTACNLSEAINDATQCAADTLGAALGDSLAAAVVCASGETGAVGAQDGTYLRVTSQTQNDFRVMLLADTPIQNGAIPTPHNANCTVDVRALLCDQSGREPVVSAVRANVQVLQNGRLPGERVELHLSGLQVWDADAGYQPIRHRGDLANPDAGMPRELTDVHMDFVVQPRGDPDGGVADGGAADAG